MDGKVVKGRLVRHRVDLAVEARKVFLEGAESRLW